MSSDCHRISRIIALSDILLIDAPPLDYARYIQDPLYYKRGGCSALEWIVDKYDSIVFRN